MGMDLSNLLVLAMIFFVLSLFAQLICSDLKFPPDLTKAITIIRWLVSGCTVVGSAPKWNLAGVSAVAVAIGSGMLLPQLAYATLRVDRIDRLNASATAAHYGSVSTGNGSW